MSLSEIRPNPHQPRTEFDSEKLAELAASIREKGILQPILVRRKADGYEIIAGERRWRAAQQAGLHEVPVLIKDFDDLEMTQAALIENIQRDDLNPVEEARAFERLVSFYGLTQEGLADSIGKSRVSITNSLRLLRLPKEILDLIHSEALTAGHARALLAVESPELQLALAREIVEKALNVRDAERLTRQKATSKPTSANGGHQERKRAADRNIQALEEKLSEHLGLKVRIFQRSNSSGRVEVSYGSLDEFGRFCDLLGITSDQTL